MRHNELLMEKIRESLRATLPITAIVLALAVTIAPLTPGTLVLFLFGALLLVVGMGLFTLGVDMSMIPMGDGIGVAISRAKKIAPPLLVCLILGIVVTVAEPDLQVLAEQLPTVPNLTLILAVALGVGVFLVLSQVRMLLHIPLSHTPGVFLRDCLYSRLFRAQRLYSRSLRLRRCDHRAHHRALYYGPGYRYGCHSKR